MFPARSYHRSQVLLSSDACAAGLFKQATDTGSGPAPAVVYRSVKSADEAATQLPKVCALGWSAGGGTATTCICFSKQRRITPATNPCCVCDAAACLQDWEQEYHCSSMRTFLAVPIVAHSSEPMLGVLTLASCQPDAFWESW
jgi:hypothetical protein